MVLLILAIAGAVLAGVCRMSLERALLAERAQADLHCRWGVMSCQSVLLPKAEAVLTSGPTAAEARRDLHLGGQTFSLIFGDEQAKANVNLLYRDAGLAGAERGVRELAASQNVRVELRPLPDVPALKSKAADAADPADVPRVFEAFGQVFTGASPADLIAAHGPATVISSSLTCWGDGSLNFRRASADAIRQVCTAHLPAAQISKLLNLRAKNPTADLSDLLDQLKLTDPARAAVEDLLVDDSSCHSLWIVSRSDGRNWYDLAVADKSAGDSSQVQSAQPLLFSW